MTLRRPLIKFAIAFAAGLCLGPAATAQTVDREHPAAADTAVNLEAAPESRTRAVLPGGDHVGPAIALLGDVDRDGRSDLVIGAYGNDSVAGDAGAVFVIAGSSGDTLLALFGRSTHDNFGASVAALGDIDGDRVPDFGVGAPGSGGEAGQEPDRGSVYLVSGADGHMIDSLHGWHAEGRFGYEISGLGDLDGDGVSEFGVGDRRGGDSSKPNFSTVYVYSGRTRETLFLLTGNQSGDRFGSAMAGVGDADGDGSGDFVIGAYRFSATFPSAGAIYLYAGKSGQPISSTTGDILLGHFGYSVAGAGDMNGDGRPDFLVGARFDDEAGGRAGKVLALSGADGRVLRRLSGQAGAQFGTSVSGTQDLNRDGRPDFAVGAPRAAPGGTGAVYLFSGADGTLLSTLAGEAVGDNFGGTVAGGHDVDGDNIPDLAVGAVGNDDGGVDAGKVYLYSGRNFSLIQSFAGRSGVTAMDTARVARVIEAERAIQKAADTLSLPEIIYDSTQVDVMPILRRSVPAEYPLTALGSGLSGWVKVRILVLADGAPGKVDIADDAGLGPDFRLAALTAARQWFFLPATKGGEPVAAWTVFPIGFAPEEARQATPGDSSSIILRTKADSIGRAASDSGAGEMVVPTGADTLPAGAVPSEPGSVGPNPAELPDSLAASSDGTDSSWIGITPSSPAADTAGEAAAPEASGVEVDPARLYELTDVDVPPVLVARVEPQYPAAARLAGDTATVVMRILVDTLGGIGRMEVKTCTLPGKGFEEAATSAVRKWHFEPARRASRKVMCWVEYALEFRI